MQPNPPQTPTYYRGRVAPHPDILADMKRRKRGLMPGLVFAPPASWDSRTLGWIGPVKDQSQCGCHDSLTEVLTEAGWAKWEDYDWTTPLGTMNPVTGNLEFQPPTAKHVYDYDGPMYYSDNQSVDFSLTPNHRLYVRKWNEAKRTLDDQYRFAEIQQMGWYAGIPHATTGWGGTEVERVRVGERSYAGDDFLALVAAVISCGWAGSSESTRNQVSFCCFREERQEELRALAHRVGMKEVPSRPGVWNLWDGALAEWFRLNTCTGDDYRAAYKRVPALVKVASQRQVGLFLRFFGDQHIQKEGTRRFYSSSPEMIDDLQELLLRVGSRGTVEERAPRECLFRGRAIRSNGPDLTLTERRTDRLSLDRKRHLRVDHYKGKVYCATVPNGTLVTRRNKSLLISGNSCWCFSGTGVVEIAGNVDGVGGGKDAFVLSEQYTLDCGRNGGCNGDDNTTVLDWAQKTGLPLTKDYGPYQARSGQCKSAQQQMFKIQEWGFADGGQGQGVTPTPLIQAAIMARGCVGCAVAAGGSWDGYQAGTEHWGNSTGIDHDVILVGWQPSKDKPGKTVWVMRNSWGPGWGDQGYMLIGEGSDSIGTEAVWATFGVAPPPIPWIV